MPATDSARRLTASYRAAAISQERSAKQRLVQLRREVNAERRAMAVTSVEEEKQQRAEELRAEKDFMFNRGMRDALVDAPRATEEEVVWLAQIFTAAMCREEIPVDRRSDAAAPGSWAASISTPSWFRLFKHIDADGSGQLSYGEFSHMARHDLQLSVGELPEEVLQRVWLSLDDDCSGLVSAGEFGWFMRLGEGCAEAESRRVFRPTARCASHRTLAWRQERAHRSREALEADMQRHAHAQLLSPEHELVQSAQRSEARIVGLERELAALRTERAAAARARPGSAPGAAPGTALSPRGDPARSSLATQLRGASRGEPLRSCSQMRVGGAARGGAVSSSFGTPPGRRPLPQPETPRRTYLMGARAGAAGWY